jgi:hypothetical protein
LEGIKRRQKNAEHAENFINKHELIESACANRAKSIPKNATIRKEYVNCKKPNCYREKHGPYYYAYWKEGKKIKKKYIGQYRYEGQLQQVQGQQQDTTTDATASNNNNEITNKKRKKKKKIDVLVNE